MRLSCVSLPVLFLWLVPCFLATAEGAEPAASAVAPGGMFDESLAGPLADVEYLVFAVRKPVRRHYYENFGYYLFPPQAYPYPPLGESAPGPAQYSGGGRLCLLHLRSGQVTVLLDDPRGAVRDPQVHYDGRKILFSYRPGEQSYFHLYEIGIDGSGLTRLTDGPFDDIEPTYTPDGSILFCSTRCRRMVGCNPSPVATLYRCNADGSDIRELSASPFTDNTPWVLPDGRVLFTRWEYVDRNQLSFHHLWTTSPDGTRQMAYFGNQYQGQHPPVPRFSDVAMLGAKPIPGTNKVVASFSPGHGRAEHQGYITVVDPALGPDVPQAARRLNSQRQFRDPYPLSEDRFLVADREGIWLMDGQGRTERIYVLPADDTQADLECHEPRPLRARPREPVLPPALDLSQSTGVLMLSDIYRGRNMDGVQPGEIKRLLVLEQLSKPVQFSGGQEPLTIGGSFTLQRVLGTVPVERDGSAYLELPAGRPLFFVALDEDDLSVKRMQSFLTVQPGEQTACVGCHEPRAQTPHTPAPPLAAMRRPSRIEPIGQVPDVFDFPRDIQPILDRHCVECHRADRREGGVELTGDRTPLYTVAYWAMIVHGLISDGRNYTGNQPPRSVGSSASRLLTLGDGSHHGAEFSPHERTMIRLWIESGGTYPGTYAALGTGIHTVEFPVETIQRRCGECHERTEVQPYHGMSNGTLLQFGYREPPQAMVPGLRDFNMVIRLAYLKFGEAPPHQWFCNLTQPEKSLLLQAPLAQAAGGLGLCGDVFASRHDPDYQQILDAIADAASRFQRHGRFDMPGFRPSPYYIRQMQTYGILPADLPLDAEIDVYATDQQYWRSLLPQ
jgi:hypothetical protein